MFGVAIGGNGFFLLVPGGGMGPFWPGGGPFWAVGEGGCGLCQKSRVWHEGTLRGLSC